MSDTLRSFEERCPYDVIYHILQRSDRPSIHALYATSHYLNSAAEPFVFSRFTLKSTSLQSTAAYYPSSSSSSPNDPLQAVDEIYEALKRNDWRRARFVQRLLVEIDSSSTNRRTRSDEGDDRDGGVDELKTRMRLRTEAVKEMKNLKVLELRVGLLDAIEALNFQNSLLPFESEPSASIGGYELQFTLPFNLEQLASNTIMPSESFILAHANTLKSLILPFIKRLPSLFPLLREPSRPHRFPNLVQLTGLHSFVTQVVPLAPLESVTIIDKLSPSTFESALLALVQTGHKIKNPQAGPPQSQPQLLDSSAPDSLDKTTSVSPTPTSSLSLTCALQADSYIDTMLSLAQLVEIECLNKRLVSLDITLEDYSFMGAAHHYGPDMDELGVVHWRILGQHSSLRMATVRLKLKASIRSPDDKERAFEVVLKGLRKGRGTLEVLRVVLDDNRRQSRRERALERCCTFVRDKSVDDDEGAGVESERKWTLYYT